MRCKKRCPQSREGEIPIEKNILVTDSLGNKLEPTYPKRAKGLVKKGRAEFLNEHHICIKDSCPAIQGINKQEDNMQNNIQTPARLEFNPREWFFHKDTKQVGLRSFITDFMGNLVESYTIGDWSWNWSAIVSPYFTLQKNTEYVFSFWLNGGENDRYQEVCNLDILFDADHDGKYVYKLNRNFIKYAMHYKGWYLYEIPFTTKDNDTTQLMFSSMAAYCTIIGAREKSYYGNLQPDEPNTDVPQRSNLIFPEGYPKDSSWSWKVFNKSDMSNSTSNNATLPNVDNIREEILSRIDIDSLIEEIVEDVVEDATAELEDILRDRLDEKK